MAVLPAPALTQARQRLTDRRRGTRLGPVVGFVVLTALLALLASSSMIGAVLAIGIAVLVLLSVTLGLYRTGVLLLMVAFVTAPMYKGLASSPNAQITPTDMLLLVAFLFLVPFLVTRRAQLPLLYVCGAGLVVATGTIGSAFSEQSVVSFLAVILWSIVMIGLPTAYALWRPSNVIIELLCWSYVAGQMISFGVGTALGHISNDNRYYGITIHPNFFAESSLMAIALLIHLFSVARSQLGRVVVLVSAGLCCFMIFLSGSRGATVVAAVMIVTIPAVERSVRATLAMLTAGAGMALLPLVMHVGSKSGNGSSIARLFGAGSAQGSNTERSQGLADGLHRVWTHPWFGEGLINLFDIHNNYLEVAAGIGIFGLLGYLLVMTVFVAPLAGLGPLRRLAYTGLAYLGWGLFIPSLYDRGIWVPLSLSIVAALPRPAGEQQAVPEAPSDVRHAPAPRRAILTAPTV